jgi:hypothetical protein
VQHDIDTLRRVVPTAAAIAIATMNSPALAEQPPKKEIPASARDVTGQPGPPDASGPATGA